MKYRQMGRCQEPAEEMEMRNQHTAKNVNNEFVYAIERGGGTRRIRGGGEMGNMITAGGVSGAQLKLEGL